MSKRFGPVVQNGFVVPDWRAAAEHWAHVLGVGPFFSMQHIDFDTCLYRNEPTPIDMTVAIAYAGDIQIELVQQHNDAPSIYRDFLDLCPSGGLHHVGVLTDDLDELLTETGTKDQVIQFGCTRIGQRFAYLDTVTHPGSMIELIETTEQTLAAFEHMKRAAREWDGVDACR